jgi:hypothetical protein
MKVNLLLTLLAAGLLASCATTARYGPATQPESIEYYQTHLDVYPGNVRKVPSQYANVHVAWAGIIVSNDATDEDLNGKIRMATVFEHHYFDWEQNRQDGGLRLLISPRGEGRFRMRWQMSRKAQDASADDAMKYAAPGKLAIVYGTPESVDEDGTIVLRYHYVRIFGPAQFRENELDYGRRSETYDANKATPGAATNSPSR